MSRIGITEDGAARPVELDNEGPNVVGRTPECRIVLRDKECSRRHCQIERTPHGFKLVDLESRNGTRVNDKVVNQALLKNGDRIQIGKAVLLFEEASPKAGSDPALRKTSMTPPPGPPVTAAGADIPAGGGLVRRKPPSALDRNVTARSRFRPRADPGQQQKKAVIVVIVVVALLCVAAVAVARMRAPVAARETPVK